ncbi:hypothetical protein AWB69_08807 [Caballeronia udeis]|uniref:Uncharacterized protein n=1 Tax=Caballeronia udeis TaxID=1232866 RepID=A0A158JVI3_9BURK|nr:hypothetical protein AWB69_08807 [Caballeronia udeis]
MIDIGQQKPGLDSTGSDLWGRMPTTNDWHKSTRGGLSTYRNNDGFLQSETDVRRTKSLNR